MTWTKEDTEAITGLARCDTDGDVLARAAAHIEALEARVRELEGQLRYMDRRIEEYDAEAVVELQALVAASIPRAVLVKALRAKAREFRENDIGWDADLVCDDLADAIERGEHLK